MDELLEALKKKLAKTESPNLDVATFYQTASMIYPGYVKQWYEDSLKERFNNIQIQATVVLSEYSYQIYPDLKVIQAENKDKQIHEKLKDVFEFSNSFNEENDLNYYLEAGFWLNARHFEILQISQLYPQV